MSKVKNRAIGELFLCSRRRLMNDLSRRVGRDHAADLVQDTFVRMLRGPTDHILDQPAYLRRVAINLAKDSSRRRQMEKKYMVADGGNHDAPSGAATAEAQIEAKERSHAIAAAVATLPPRCRAVFELRVQQNHTPAMIAERLGLSRKTVEQHLRIAVQRCQAALAALDD